MHDSLTEAPTGALIDHIWTRFHDTHRRELPELVALARWVEAAHATDCNTPHGLTRALEQMIAELGAHMREEEVLFLALRTGHAGHAVTSIAHLREDHDGHGATLNRIAAITHGFRLPHDACQSWRRLYEGFGKLAEDLDEHMYFENAVLFARIEARA